ncbi:DNA-binding transcriptional regulator, AcrR family [Amycolatopsis xylanica]|uniref:DNA-binding transcriptional regulator, AcrR family n=1 Tax=Amycolatopsis xylanica TaxID=589385 RepID=A0A1H3CLG4_9PSEU|nr:TetR/AcrR family transcriptional regulator [Amycolatopsis xylanica]SDX54269.1 DNA-binding transcriptional regulator, AcrR family [Amycolatopsis xylanica]
MATELPGTTRPGGRTERTRQAVLHATLAELAAHGYAALTVDAVAERSGIHKTTIYRRWGSAEGLVAAALGLGSEDEWEAPDTGSLRGDLAALLGELVDYFTDPALLALPTASVTAAFLSERAADALRDFYRDRHARSAVVVSRAIARGEAPARTDAVEVIRAACGPLFYRLFISREVVDRSVSEEIARSVAIATGAGAYVPAS